MKDHLFYCHEKRGLAAKESKKCLPIHFVYLMYIICQDSIIMWSTLKKHVEISIMLLPWLEHFWNLPIALNNRSRRQLIERQRKNRVGIKRRFFLYQQFNVDATGRFIISTSTSSIFHIRARNMGHPVTLWSYLFLVYSYNNKKERLILCRCECTIEYNGKMDGHMYEKWENWWQ